MQHRRIVTGHDEQGRSMATVDEVVQNLKTTRPGVTWVPVWATEGFPVDNDDKTDGGKRDVATFQPNGTVFRVVEILPGAARRNHRTDSIDYAIVMAGELDMELDNETVHLNAGDAVVQRGTLHNWANNSNEPCIIAFVLIDAKPASAAGQTLHAEG